jgi:ATP citrate (pro-S)-lyase
MAHLKFDTAVRDFEAHVEHVFAQTEKENPWLLKEKLVTKPDQLIKRRGKNGLLGIKLDWEAAKEWIRGKAGKPFKVRIKL